MSDSARITQQLRRRLVREEMRPGESPISVWCQDVALGCECPPDVLWNGLPVVPVVRGVAREIVHGVESAHLVYDRCLGCGATWLARDYRWDASRPVTVGACVPFSRLKEARSKITTAALLILDGVSVRDAALAAGLAQNGKPRVELVRRSVDAMFPPARAATEAA